MDIIAPQTKELWEKSCCIDQSWYRTAEEMKRHASSLEEENGKLQNKLDEMTAYADKLAQGLPCLPKDVEVLREANARLAQENHNLLEQMFQTAVGLLSTYGKFAYMHPEELLMYLKNEFKK